MYNVYQIMAGDAALRKAVPAGIQSPLSFNLHCTAVKRIMLSSIKKSDWVGIIR